MPIDTVDIFGSDQVGIHLASVGNVLFHPPELPEPTIAMLDATLGLSAIPSRSVVQIWWEHLSAVTAVVSPWQTLPTRGTSTS